MIEQDSEVWGERNKVSGGPQESHIWLEPRNSLQEVMRAGSQEYQVEITEKELETFFCSTVEKSTRNSQQVSISGER